MGPEWLTIFCVSLSAPARHVYSLSQFKSCRNFDELISLNFLYKLELRMLHIFNYMFHQASIRCCGCLAIESSQIFFFTVYNYCFIWYLFFYFNILSKFYLQFYFNFNLIFFFWYLLCLKFTLKNDCKILLTKDVLFLY